MEFFNAFWVGGVICALAQLLMEKTKMLPGRVISALGLYESFAGYAGAGATVPLMGYGHLLMTGVKDALKEDGFIGLFKGGFTSGSAGLCAALIFGYLASFVFSPKMKK